MIPAACWIPVDDVVPPRRRHGFETNGSTARLACGISTPSSPSNVCTLRRPVIGALWPARRDRASARGDSQADAVDEPASALDVESNGGVSAVMRASQTA